MARPQSPDYEKRREAMIRAAADLYARRGFASSSIADLAKACSTSKSLVYHYFPSKEDILQEVMAAHLDALVTAADAALAGPGDAAAKLRAMTGAFMRLYIGAENSHKVLLAELGSLPPGRRAEVVAKQRRIVAAVEGLMRALRPDLVGTPLTLPLTMLFFGMINWTHTWYRADGPVDVDRLAGIVIALMLGGLGGVQAS